MKMIRILAVACLPIFSAFGMFSVDTAHIFNNTDKVIYVTFTPQNVSQAQTGGHASPFQRARFSCEIRPQEIYLIPAELPAEKYSIKAIALSDALIRPTSASAQFSSHLQLFINEPIMGQLELTGVVQSVGSEEHMTKLKAENYNSYRHRK